MNRFNKVFLVFLFAFAFLGCTTNSDKQGANAFPAELLLKAKDLPSGFRRESISFKHDIPNADSQVVDFVFPDGSEHPAIRISHQLSIYVDQQSALNAYPGWEKTWLPTEEWKAPKGFHFIPIDSGDISHFGCILGSLDGKQLTYCTLLQQHENIISLVYASLDGDVFNQADLESVLASLDARLPKEK